MSDNQAQFIPEESSPIVEKFINYVMLGGKKTTARKIINDTFKIIGKKTSNDPEKVFKTAIDKVKPRLEVKAKRIGGAVYQIPREVKPARQIALAFRWIIGAARGKKGANMCQKLANELIDASNEQGLAVKKKEDTHRMAEANKAFAHFARY
ncbi:30S ribosomal protein S7 [Candidatus Peregrinibacteria bacterium]|jgi:small subunit ribosomal protein S7|nr:30S ribosomal protein S7 [Candidatus Peregrinibacteria bacterium]MBT7736871.1 30S ribosomal protein S7 [Candidatus Peregrinibacteria bacterium]